MICPFWVLAVVVMQGR
uniref:Uncharacterized protein n=1 Tax=Rhizophora mucronata TaxID=61149 RepID=A0A2P2MZE3_RHIMU